MHVTKHYVGFIIAAGLFISAPTHAQSFQGGLEVGAHAIALDYSDPLDDWDTSFRPSFSFFAFGSTRVRGALRITSGLRYVRLGNNVAYDLENMETRRLPDGSTEHFLQRYMGENWTTQHYLTIPIRIGYDLREGRYFVFLGPEVGRLLAARIVSDTVLPEVSSEELDIYDDLKSWNVAMTVGLGTNVDVKGHTWQVQAMYSNGLTGVADGNWVTNWRTQEFGVTLGYLLK